MKTSLSILLATALPLAAAPPVVSNITASQRPGTKLVDIHYDVAGSGPFHVTFEASPDNGSTFNIPCSTLYGNVGSDVTAGTGKYAIWNAGADWNGQYSENMRVKVVATDGTGSAVPAGMAWIPAGAASGGDPVSEFFIDRYEVSLSLWQAVLTWGIGHGYNIGSGSGAGATHPVVNMTWYDAVKWCNARSEKEGLTPCYYISTTFDTANVYRSGNVDVQNTWVKWNANGYRLPTEAEWHRAAAGNSGTDYPWGATMTGADGNYSSSGDPFGSASIQTTPVGYYNGTTYDLGGGNTFATNDRKNEFGLYDVCGNAWEWCWNWYGGGYPSSTSNSHGPDTGSGRVPRGGGWSNGASGCRVANRSYGNPTGSSNGLGFRTARSSVP